MFIYILKEADSFFFCFRGDEVCPMGGGSVCLVEAL